MDQEGIDGVRMTWNFWPQTKAEASKCVVPVAACTSPICHHRDVVTLPYAPLCRTCAAALNPFATVDFAGKKWICPLCLQRNTLPVHYHQISETNLPVHYTTIEYTLPNQSDHPTGAPPPVFVFALDTCMIDEEFGFAKSVLKQAIGLIPDNALIGFVSFGAQAYVHELRPRSMFLGETERFQRSKFWSN